MSDSLILRSLCPLQARNKEAVDTSWVALTAIVSVQVAERRVRAQTPVSPIMIATLVIF